MLTEEQTTEIEKIRQTSTSLDRIAAWPVDTIEQQATAKKFLELVHDQIKSIENLRTGITKPLLESKRKVDELFKSLAEPYERCKSLLKEKLESTAEAHLEAIYSGGDVQELGVAASFVWEYEVYDPDLVPREYCAPNHAAIKRYTSAYRRSDVIEPLPGINFIRKAKVRS